MEALIVQIIRREGVEVHSASDPLVRIGAAKLLPVIRTPDADRAVEVAGRLAAAGLTVLEMTATTRDWAQAVTHIVAEHPEICVGVGTVTVTADAELAIASGAQFLVSPRLVPEVRNAARDKGILLIEGGLTPTEIAIALQGGIAKLFPAHIGGPSYLRSVLTVVPGAKIVPTGGIPLDEVRTWLDAGAYAVGVGSDLTAGGDVESRLRRLDLAR